MRLGWRLLSLAGVLFAAIPGRADWIGDVDGTENYLLPANWSGGAVNGRVFPNLISSTLTLELTNDYSTVGNGDFNVNGILGDLVIMGTNGGGGANWSLTALGNRTLYLAGDFLYDRAGNGPASFGSTLTVDLLGGTRLFQNYNPYITWGPDTLTINGTVTNGGLTYAGGGNLTFAATSKPLYTGMTSVTGGTLTFSAAPAGTYYETRGGTLVFNSVAPSSAATISCGSGTVILQGASGALAANHALSMDGGTLQLGDGTGNHNDRIPDSVALDLSRGGTLRLQGVNSGPTTESISARLRGFINLVVTNGTGGTATLTVNDDRTDRGLVTLQADQGNSKLLFTSNPAGLGAGGAPGTTTMSIVPWAVGGSGSALRFATYDNSTGFRLLDTSTELWSVTLPTGNQLTNLAAAGASENVRVVSTAGDGAGIDIGATSKTINSLVYYAQGNGRILGSGGMLTITSGGLALRNGGNPLTISVSTLNFGGNEGIIRVEQVGGALAVNESVTVSSTITNTGGKGLTLRAYSNTADNGRLILSGNNKYTGPTTLAYGRVEVSGGNAIPDLSQVRISPSATLRLAGNETIGGLLGSGLVTNDASARSLTISNVTDCTFSGALVSGLSLVKNGAGRQTLSGTNTYTGTTVVNAGALVVNGSHSGGGAYTVASGATLGGNGTISGSSTVTVNNAGTIAPGQSPGTLTVPSLTLATGANYAYEFGDLVTTTGELVLTNGTWNLALDSLGRGFQDGGSIKLFNFGTLAGTPVNPQVFYSNPGFSPTGPVSLAVIGNSLYLNGVSIIPEPVLFGLLLAGGGILVWARRRGKP